MYHSIKATITKFQKSEKALTTLQRCQSRKLVYLSPLNIYLPKKSFNHVKALYA